jgi:hypothetical protein
VRSPHVLREAIRWDVLLARVMAGDRTSFWGPARFFEPCEEPELRAELARVAGSPLDELDEHALASIFRRHALELMRFIPPSRSAEPSFFTLEGDPLAFASATWEVRDPATAAEKMRDLGGLLPDDPVEIDITAPRATLVRQRPPLPQGALVLESSPVGAPDTIPIATLRLEADKLQAEAISEQRLAQTIEIVAADLGELVELRSQSVTSVDEALAARQADRHDSTPQAVDAAERLLVGDFVNERMRRWLDEPHWLLDGRTPREAVAGAGRAEVVRLLRQIENGAERSRRRGEPSRRCGAAAGRARPERRARGLNRRAALRFACACDSLAKRGVSAGWIGIVRCLPPFAFRIRSSRREGSTPSQSSPTSFAATQPAVRD